MPASRFASHARAPVPHGHLVRGPDEEEAREEGITIARESLLEVHDLIAGVQVSAPFGNVKYALQVFEVLDEFKGKINIVSN